LKKVKEEKGRRRREGGEGKEEKGRRRKGASYYVLLDLTCLDLDFCDWKKQKRTNLRTDLRTATVPGACWCHPRCCDEGNFFWGAKILPVSPPSGRSLVN
jgi:hypothetical protein